MFSSSCFLLLYLKAWLLSSNTCTSFSPRNNSIWVQAMTWEFFHVLSCVAPKGEIQSNKECTAGRGQNGKVMFFFLYLHFFYIYTFLHTISTPFFLYILPAEQKRMLSELLKKETGKVGGGRLHPTPAPSRLRR